jgi:hypothetical protein
MHSLQDDAITRYMADNSKIYNTTVGKYFPSTTVFFFQQALPFYSLILQYSVSGMQSLNVLCAVTQMQLSVLFCVSSNSNTVKLQ